MRVCASPCCTSLYVPQADARQFAKEALDAADNREEKDISANIKVGMWFRAWRVGGHAPRPPFGRRVCGCRWGVRGCVCVWGGGGSLGVAPNVSLPVYCGGLAATI